VSGTSLRCHAEQPSPLRDHWSSGGAATGALRGSAAWSRDRNDAVTADSQTSGMNVAALEILVLRAWLEPGDKPGLRVRLVAVAPGQADRHVLSTTSADDACQAVRNWLMGIEPAAAAHDL
jgi:hypothetical protein